MSLLTSLQRKGPSGFGSGSTAEDVTLGLDLSRRTVLVTGCNSGIGHETVRVLAKRDARVIATARTEDKARAAVADLGKDMVPGEDITSPTRAIVARTSRAASFLPAVETS
jgi:NAD(P)-dependent dehydrogenase (short-subunit alcohol dehydrogenase family)